MKDMNKKYIGFAIVAVVVIFAIIMIKKNNTIVPTVSENNNPVDSTQTTGEVKAEITIDSTATTAVTTTPVTKTFTLADVMTHNTETDCYSAINGNVYDLTAWIKKHPGGDRNILRICGLDGSSAFNGQHGTDLKPERILAGFEVGTLRQ